MSEWITQREAAALLGVHPSTIPKMLRRGELHARTQRRPSLSRSEVMALKATRAAPRPPRPPRPRKGRSVPQPPDNQHPWLNSDEAALLMGVGRSAVLDRAMRGRLPSERHDGRRWFRRDLLDLVRRADEVKRGLVSPSPPVDDGL